MRPAAEASATRLAQAGVAELSRRKHAPNHLQRTRGWQTGKWTIVEAEVEQNGGHGSVVVAGVGSDIVSIVDNARVVDWIS